MRVSTAQFYFQNAQKLSSLQTKVNEHAEHIVANKRILTAKDDAVSFGTLTGFKNELANIDKYKRNIIQAESRNNLQEVNFTRTEEIMQQLKQTFIKANNGTLNDEDLAALGDIVKSGQGELLDVANTKDETGGYIFSGYKVGVTPFVIQPDNSVSYRGDSGVRELQIAKNIMVDTNQAGDAVFEKISNVLGDFSPTYNPSNSGISVNRAVINNPSAYDDVTNPPPYNFNFNPSQTDLTVTDSLGNIVFGTGTYVPGQTIAFNGIEVQLNGNPSPGDDIDLKPQENISLFDTLKGMSDWLAVGASPVNPAQHSVDYNELLGQLDQALNHMSTRRVDAGVRQKLIDNQESSHLDSELHLAKGQSNIEDLDFAKATADFERSKFSLQAAQQTFVQVKSLSLFNYL